MNNIDFLIKQQTIYSSKQSEFFKRKKLQVEVEDTFECKVQVVTSPNKQTKYILQMQDADAKQIAKALQNQYMIEILELKDCRLKSVPSEVFQMQKLKVLKLESNFIKVAPIIEVEVLSLKNNLLLHYTAGEKVKILDLSQNKLQEFSFGAKLEELYVSANEFTVLPQLPPSIQKLELDWFKYTEPPLDQLQTQPLINLLTYQPVPCIDFLKMFSKKELQNKIIEASLAQDLGVLSSLSKIMDLNLQDDNGDTALSLALKTDNLFSVRHLIEIGAQIELGSYQQGNILSYALESNLPTIINLIFPKLNSAIFTEDVYGNSPLHYLVRCDYDDINSKIVMKAKSLNIQMTYNVYGQTPIHLAIMKSKNWLLSTMLKYYQIDCEDLYALASKSDNLGAVLLLIQNKYYFEGLSNNIICKNIKIYRLLKSYEIYSVKSQLKKHSPQKNNFHYEVKLMNKKDPQINNCQSFINLKQQKAQNIVDDEEQSQAQKSLNYIKLLRQYVLFQTLFTKQQKQYLVKQLLQRIKELKASKLDQLTIISDILLTFYFDVDKHFLSETEKYLPYLNQGQHYLLAYIYVPISQDTLLQYEQFQN